MTFKIGSKWWWPLNPQKKIKEKKKKKKERSNLNKQTKFKWK